MDDLRIKFGKDFSYIEQGVDYAAWLLTHGTYSQRNPHLGRMVTCPICRHRHRQALPCCLPKYATDIEGIPLDDTVEYAIRFERSKGKECLTERSIGIFSNRTKREMMRQFSRHRRPSSAGFKNRKRIRDSVLEMQAGIREVGDIQYYSPNSLVVQAAREMHIPTPEVRNIPAFAERYYLWKMKLTKRSRRVARRTRQGA